MKSKKLITLLSAFAVSGAASAGLVEDGSNFNGIYVHIETETCVQDVLDMGMGVASSAQIQVIAEPGRIDSALLSLRSGKSVILSNGSPIPLDGTFEVFAAKGTFLSPNELETQHNNGQPPAGGAFVPADRYEDFVLDQIGNLHVTDHAYGKIERECIYKRLNSKP